MESKGRCKQKSGLKNSKSSNKHGNYEIYPDLALQIRMNDAVSYSYT